MANLGETGGHVHSLDHPASPITESGSHVAEIVESSRTKARTMVDAAVQVLTNQLCYCFLAHNLIATFFFC